MFQNPVLQQQLARELDRDKAQLWQDQAALEPTESVLDSVLRRLKQLIAPRSLQPLARSSA